MTKQREALELARNALKTAQQNIAPCRPEGSSSPYSQHYNHDAFLWDFYEIPIRSIEVALAKPDGWQPTNDDFYLAVNGEITRLRAELAAAQEVNAKLRLSFAQIECSMSQAKIPGNDKYREIFLSHGIAEQALALPNDRTALDEMLKAAKREALLEAAEEHGDAEGLMSVDDVKRMANKEIK